MIEEDGPWAHHNFLKCPATRSPLRIVHFFNRSDVESFTMLVTVDIVEVLDTWLERQAKEKRAHNKTYYQAGLGVRIVITHTADVFGDLAWILLVNANLITPSRVKLVLKRME